MSAAVCGIKRSRLLEEFSPSAPLTKKLCCSSPVIRSALPECDNNRDAAFKMLNDLCYRTAEVNVDAGKLENDENNASASRNLPAFNNLPADGAEWINSFLEEMVILRKENSMLKQKIEESSDYECNKTQELLNLKQLVSQYQEQIRNLENKTQELQHLKQLLSQHQEQIRNLERNKYELEWHLKQAQQSNAFPGHFPRHFF